MAFSFRKMLSNISYFKKPGEDDSPNNDVPTDCNLKKRRHTYASPEDERKTINFEKAEPDSTSKQCATSLKLPDSLKNYAAKKGSLSDTDLLTLSVESIDKTAKKGRKKCKKLRLDVKKANRSMSEALNHSDNDNSSNNGENTPKHILLDGKNLDLFSERLKEFDFNKSFDMFDAMSDEELTSSHENEEMDIESLADHSDSDVSIISDEGKVTLKMCRKVGQMDNLSNNVDNRIIPSASPESFEDIELDKNEEERISLLLSYQMKLEKLECFLQKLLTEFRFHIEVSKIFHCRSIVTALPGTDVTKIPKILGEITYLDNVSRGVSPTGSWSIVMEKEDELTKFKVKKQLLSMKHSINDFINMYFKKDKIKTKQMLTHGPRSITYNQYEGKHIPHKRIRMNDKKKNKHFDFPDIREAMINLFSMDSENDLGNDTIIFSDIEDAETPKCVCKCHHHMSSETDSGLTTKDQSLSNHSISSSIGNFSLDSSTLTAYSESLERVISYNSFQDTSLYSTLLQKAAIERITFYVQVHSIQLKCEQTEQDFESKNKITFHCPACKINEINENDLLKHILSQTHCEKIHFLYKTAYIKKCVASGKEIQPSTVLNPMTMYRDENKIVCFGDAMYACSLCFENLIIGESVLMSHCSESEHVNRREKLSEILE